MQMPRLSFVGLNARVSGQQSPGPLKLRQKDLQVKDYMLEYNQDAGQDTCISSEDQGEKLRMGTCFSEQNASPVCTMALSPAAQKQ